MHPLHPPMCPRLNTSHYPTVGGLNIIRNVIVSGYVTFYQITNFRKYIIFSFLTKFLCGRMKRLLGPDLVRGKGRIKGETGEISPGPPLQGAPMMKFICFK